MREVLVLTLIESLGVEVVSGGVVSQDRALTDWCHSFNPMTTRKCSVAGFLL